MKITHWFTGFAVAASLFAAVPVAAQPYPNKPIKFIVPYAAGSASDILARTIADPLSKAMGQPFILDNKPGNNSTLGTQVVARSAPDGYTLALATNSGLAASPGGLTGGVQYDPVKDLSYVSLVGSIYYVWVVNNDVQAKTARELIDLIKAHPGKYNYASGNTGGISFGGHIKNTYGLDMTHVPYKSTPPALVDLIGGQVQVMMADVASSVPMIKAGKVRAVGVPSAQRNPLLPDVPTFAEYGLQTPPDMRGWWTVVAPAGTPEDIMDRLNSELVKILNTPSVKATLLQNGIVAMPSTRQEATQYQKEQLQVWKTIVKDLNLKAD